MNNVQENFYWGKLFLTMSWLSQLIISEWTKSEMTTKKITLHTLIINYLVGIIFFVSNIIFHHLCVFSLCKHMIEFIQVTGWPNVATDANPKAGRVLRLGIPSRMI